MSAPDPLLDSRREFPILEKTYLISNSLGGTGVWKRWSDRPASVT